MFQNNYTPKFVSNLPGTLADNAEMQRLDDYHNPNNAKIIPGTVCWVDTVAPTAIIADPTNTIGAAIPVGLVTRELDFHLCDSTDIDENFGEFPENSQPHLYPKLLKYGRLHVACEADAPLAFGTPVFARITANGAGKDVIGALRADADGGNAVQITELSCLEPADADNRTIVKFLWEMA